MYQELRHELRTNALSLFKQGWLRFVGLTLASLSFLLVAVCLSSYTFYVSLFLMMGALPFFFLITLEVHASITNKRSAKLNTKEGLNAYYTKGRGLYRTLGAGLLSIALYFVVEAILAAIALFMMRFYDPQSYQVLETGLASLDLTNATELQDFLNANMNLINPVYTVGYCGGLLAGISLFYYLTHRNEMSFYCLNYIMADNKLRITPLPMTIVLFKKALFPTIRKEYRSINFKANYWTYLMFIVPFIAVTAIGMATGLYYLYTMMIAFAAGLLFYSPCYAYIRLFDALFFIAFGDDMVERSPNNIKEMIANARKELESQIIIEPTIVPDEDNVKDEPNVGGIVLSEEEKKKLAQEVESSDIKDETKE